jgi:hypothetical protein
MDTIGERHKRIFLKHADNNTVRFCDFNRLPRLDVIVLRYHAAGIVEMPPRAALGFSQCWG